ncbi:MAG: DnaB-like helicase C-terminal domain-containing protein, partial [Cytophagales bacterium]|nr:DnaB-like helicase C-terminal domain-containing protein [Cytophagales bacterium]
IYNLLKENIITVTEKTAEETYTDLINKTNKIMQRNEKEETFIEQISKTGEEIEKNYKNRDDYSLYTGITDLDDKILGLHNGELTIIGARPGVGKTTFALQIAQKIAERKKKVAILSLEMSDVQLIQKLISKKTGVNSYKMRSGNLVDDDWDKIAEGIGELSDLPIRIITKAFNIQQIEKTIRKLKNKNELDLVVIDYIQLIKNQGNFSSREQQVADISRTLKLLTLELNIPIIALCQLNRNANKTEPTLADLRESGSIEQDADNVFFLYQEKEQDTPIVDIVLKIAKQRNGEIGKVYLKFNKPKSEFVGQVRW